MQDKNCIKPLNKLGTKRKVEYMTVACWLVQTLSRDMDFYGESYYNSEVRFSGCAARNAHRSWNFRSENWRLSRWIFKQCHMSGSAVALNTITGVMQLWVRGPGPVCGAPIDPQLNRLLVIRRPLGSHQIHYCGENYHFFSNSMSNKACCLYRITETSVSGSSCNNWGCFLFGLTSKYRKYP